MFKRNNIMKKVCIIFMSYLFLLTLLGCSTKQINISTTTEANRAKESEAALQNTQSKTVRAEGKSGYGVLSIVPVGSEIIEQLGASSVYGGGDDYSFKGDYKVLFKDNNGNESVIAKLDDLNIIQPQNAVISFQKMSMGDTDIFYFIPQYQGSNDIPIKFFGVTKDGNAFEFKIENNKAQESEDVKALSEWAFELSTNSKDYSPPAIQNENLILRAVYNIGEGQNYVIYNVTFHVDMKDRIFKYITKEVYDDAEKAVWQYIDSIDKQDWETYMQFVPQYETAEMKRFLADPENKGDSIGILSVQSAKVKEIMALPEKESIRFTRLDEYKARYGEVRAFLIGVIYQVKNESKYIYNGVNYTLMFLGRENNQWKVIENSSAPLEMLKQDGYYFGSADEAAAIKIIEFRTRGIEINMDGKVLGYNGAKGIFLPEVTLENGGITVDEASKTILKVFLEHFKSGNNLQNEKIKDYRPGKTEITQKEAGGFFVFSAEFSVQTDSGSNDWFVGNGRLAEDGWVNYKLYFFTQRDENGKYKGIGWTAYK